MIRFRFELRSLDDVTLWGEPPGLHWFGLTDGWYWIEVGGRELLRRTRCDDPRPYVDYQVVRFWEDINAITPAVLEAVPEDLLPFIASDPESWVRNFLEYVGSADDGGDPDAPDHPVVAAAVWHGEHNVDLGYLLNAPGLRFWRAAGGGKDEIFLDWRHEDDGHIGFTAGPAARFSFPAADYLSAVRRLDRELIAAMQQRVEELERRGGLPGVDLDLAGLRREHEDRSRWLARRLERTPTTDWAVIRQGARELLGASGGL